MGKFELGTYYKESEDDYNDWASQTNNLPQLLRSDASINNNDDQLNRRDNAYSNLIEVFVDTYSQNQSERLKKKWSFYILIIVIFIVFLVFVFASIIMIFINFKSDVPTFLITFLSSFFGLFSSIIILPRTIAKYLFDTKEDEIISKVIIEMQKEDRVNRNSNREILSN